ncbi:hypothetical protein [Desulfocicer niacini]
MRTKVVTHSKFGVRNVWCQDYGRCLDQAIESGAGGFACRGCHLEYDHAGMPKDTGELKEDAANCMALLISVFMRVKIQDAKNRVAL